ncbi:hypothetical protein ACH5RR_020812 [Cinchona calisaya]|uniref:Uncharacterized protein n=1 Tax=Cinchona calisaya TaxID=153742 RepID=A0ABD2ZKJ3_9GENT
MNRVTVNLFREFICLLFRNANEKIGILMELFSEASEREIKGDKAGLALLKGHNVVGDAVVDLREAADGEEAVVRRYQQKSLKLI